LSYQLEHNEDIPTGIKRIMTEQVDKALASLSNVDAEFDENIHDARKRFKKVRAVVRLVRDDIGKDVYKRENIAYRDAGRALSSVRDSAVFIETLDRIKSHYDDELTDTAFAEVRDKLVSRHQKTQDDIREKSTVTHVKGDIMSARDRIADLPIGSSDFSAVRDGLKRVYKRGYKGFHHTYDNPTPHNFHEWRKRIKYLWYQTRILKLVWYEPLDIVADEIHDLSDILGDAHDLAEFEDLIKTETTLTENQEAQQALIGLASRWRKQLEDSAKPLARRIYAEQPKAFIERFEHYWDAYMMDV